LNQDLITLILLAVCLLCAISVVLIGRWLFRNGPLSKKQGRISRFVAPRLDDSQVTPSGGPSLNSKRDIGELRNWVNKSLNSVSSDKMQKKISSAYWAITGTEYTLIRIVATATAFFLGWFIPGNILGGIFLGAIAIMVPPILLERAIAQRQQKFNDQLLDVLVLIVGAVQAGYSLMQAIDLAVNEIPAPSSEEFGRVFREIRLGISLEGALTNLSERMASDDMQIVVTAVVINTQVGGNLSTVLESTISTIRDRQQLLGEIRSLSSYSRFVGSFLTLMPFITGVAIFFLAPDYFETVKTSLFTQIALLMALLGVIIGNIWIKRIVQIKV